MDRTRRSLPLMHYSPRVGSRAGGLGLRWPDKGVRDFRLASARYTGRRLYRRAVEFHFTGRRRAVPLFMVPFHAFQVQDDGEDNALVFASSVCAMQEAAVWVLGSLLSPTLFPGVDAARFVAKSGASRGLVALVAAAVRLLAWRLAAIRQPGMIRASFWVYCLVWNLAVWR